MKKIIALFGSLLIFAGTKSKAQNPTQVPVKKETVKPASALKGEKTASGAKKVSFSFTKGAHPSFKGAQSATNQQVAPRHTPPKG